MAGKIYSLGTTTKDADLKAALLDFYGAQNVTIHYQGASCIVFSVPAITNKVIKIDFSSITNVYYGDAWTSGTTITNQVTAASTSDNQVTSYVGKAVLCANSIFLKLQSGGGNNVILISKTSNNDCAFLSFENNSDTSKGNLIGTLISTGARIYPALMNGTFKSGTGNVALMSIYLQDTNGNLLVDTNGSPVYLTDIKQTPSLKTTLESSSNFITNYGPYYYTNYNSYGGGFSNSFIMILV